MLFRRVIWLQSLCVFAFWSPAHSLAQTAELRVIGQATLQAQLTTSADGNSVVTGRLSDEAGSPLGGSLTVSSLAGRKLSLEQCPASSRGEDRSAPAARAPETISESGEFCVRLQANYSEVILVAQSPHFEDSKKRLHNDGAPRLPSPHFIKAPQTLDLGASDPAVVEVLTDGTPGPPIAGAELSLSLSCATRATVIERAKLSTDKLARFEFFVSDATPPGNCLLIAETSALGQAPRIDRRNVLVRSAVALSFVELREENSHLRATVQVETTSHVPVTEGIIEVTSKGAHLASAPVSDGKSVLVIDRGEKTREVELAYVPSGPAHVPLSALSLEVSAKKPGFRWMTLHTLGLCLFCAWIAYAWLRPRGKSKNHLTPPKKPLVQSTTRTGGPIMGWVHDAHTGEVIAGARVALVSVGVEDVREEEVTRSDEQGRFVFETRAGKIPHLRLSATARGYMGLRAHAEGNEISVHLSELRREAVRQLIEWTKRTGRPFARKPAPTPLEVAEIARHNDRAREQAWANRVAELAYQHNPPTEEEVRGAASPEGFDPIQ